jgi:ribonuclease D
MSFSSNIKPEEVEILHVAEFSGPIKVIDAVDDNYFEAVSYLGAQKFIGFDTETKPSFTANTKRNTVALLQLAGVDRAYIFRLHSLGIPPELARILSTTRVIKVGAAVNDDIRALQYHTKFIARGFVDLQTIASGWGVMEKSVRKMAAIILGTRVSKSQQLSNWETPELSQAQISYAAVDAWICLKMYLKLLSTPKPDAKNIS